MAWIEGAFHYWPRQYSVHLMTHEKHSVLDAGDSFDSSGVDWIDPLSLTSDGATIFWTHGGQRRSAPFG